jgi:predicted RNA-binding Zn-ribbon protein involved in translation (DUF1610 family)
MEILSTIFLVAMAILLGLIVYGTIVKNKWGINFKRVSCPQCGAAAPIARKPTSVNEALWGGYTCQKCGCHMDKWGRRTT